MVKQLYPRVEINLKYLTENVATVVKKCSEKGIKIAGVMKGTTGIPQCSKCFEDGGASLIASSASISAFVVTGAFFVACSAICA